MTTKFKTIRLLILFFSSFLFWSSTSQTIKADYLKESSRHHNTKDLKRESDNCFNGECSMSADEAWGRAGRAAYVAGLRSIAANNSHVPAKSLDSWQKDRLRPYFGDLVDRVTIKYGATTLDSWNIGNMRVKTPSKSQTFCNNIYLSQRHRAEDRSLLKTIAHELVHSQQCEELGGASNFGYNYFKYYKRADEDYQNNRLEVEAYNIAQRFDNRLDAIQRKIPVRKRPARWGNNLGDKIKSNIKMPQGSFLQSKDGRFKMVVQGDGNLVIYQDSNSIWASNTAGKGSPKFELAVQNDGNLVLYGADTAIWASKTDGVGSAPYTLVMQNDGNLVLYDRNNSIWQSGTCCR